jgi:hypothetical protein
MANPSKKKGTGGETELLRLLSINGMVRTPPASPWDLERPGTFDDEAWADGYDLTDVTIMPDPPLNALATRPDNGKWLVTVDLDTFRELVRRSFWTGPIRVEVKRYARFALHGIWVKKFGNK